jgi:hypothetical protein
MAISKRTTAPANTKAESPKAAATPAAAPPSVETISMRAYQLWRESGCAHGNDQAHWFRAERELRAGSARSR